MSGVEGYRELTSTIIDTVNEFKRAEERLLRVFDAMIGDKRVDQRWLAIGRTGLEQGFMAVNRSMFNPNRINLPEDEQ